MTRRREPDQPHPPARPGRRIPHALRVAAGLRRGGQVRAARSGAAVSAGGRAGGRRAGQGRHRRGADRSGPAGRGTAVPSGRAARLGHRARRTPRRAARVSRRAGRLPAPGVVAAAHRAAPPPRTADPALGRLDRGGTAGRGAGVRGGAAGALRGGLRSDPSDAEHGPRRGRRRGVGRPGAGGSVPRRAGDGGRRRGAARRGGDRGAAGRVDAVPARPLDVVVRILNNIRAWAAARPEQSAVALWAVELLLAAALASGAVAP